MTLFSTWFELFSTWFEFCCLVARQGCLVLAQNDAGNELLAIHSLHALDGQVCVCNNLQFGQLADQLVGQVASQPLCTSLPCTAC